MDPATLASIAVAALVQYVGRKAVGLAERAGRDVDQAVDERLDRLYEAVRGCLAPNRRAERALRDLEGNPGDTRRQGRLELAIEGVLQDDPVFAAKLTAMLDDLAQRPPPGGVSVRDAGPVALHGDVVIRGRNVAGRDLTIGHHD
ncbi:MAG TPA: hypothetical protein VFH30_09475 [Acidimicrobiales bacterium]|nr:hypothetical protein [Acidimicrobiales bacterium]